MRVTSSVLVASLVALVGCSSKSSPTATPAGTSGSVCSFSGSIPTLADAGIQSSDLEYGDLPSGVSLQQYAEAQGNLFLDAFVGSYLRGDVVVYTGTLSAHDNQSVLGTDCNGGESACANGLIAESPAIASYFESQGVATLAVHSPDAKGYVTFSQTAGDAKVTTIGLVLSDTSVGGNSGTCSGCVPDFTSKPSSLSFKDIESSGQVAINAAFGTDGGMAVELHTYATASLTKTTPCDLTFNDIVELNAGPADQTTTPIALPQGTAFTLQSGLMVALVQGSIYGPSASGQYCSMGYSIELFVDPTNLASYGVRNFQTFTPDASYDPCP